MKALAFSVKAFRSFGGIVFEKKRKGVGAGRSTARYVRKEQKIASVKPYFTGVYTFDGNHVVGNVFRGRQYRTGYDRISIDAVHNGPRYFQRTAVYFAQIQMLYSQLYYGNPLYFYFRALYFGGNLPRVR